MEKRQNYLRNLGYSEKTIGYLDRNCNLGWINKPSVIVYLEGNNEELLTLYLTINDSMITDARFIFMGDLGLQACAATLTDMIIGKNLEELSFIKKDDIIAYSEGIPSDKSEAAEFALETLNAAINKYRSEMLELEAAI